MAAGSGRGGLGWVILAAALAVPGFLFYNWWSHLKAERDHAISAKAIRRADGGMFQTPPPAAGRLVNPISSSTSAPAGLPSPAAASRTPAGPAGSPVALAAGTIPSPSAAAAETAKSPPPAAAPSAVTLSTTSTIVLLRDPMMSPLDIVRLQEAAQAEADRLAALARPRAPARRRRRVQAPIKSFIELQGIVAKADGESLAIINGSTVSPGESFAIENYAGKVKVLRITSSEVTFEYNHRKFKLNVNAE